MFVSSAGSRIQGHFRAEELVFPSADGIPLTCSLWLQSFEMVKYPGTAMFQCGASTESTVDPTFFHSRVVGNRKQSKSQSALGEGTRGGVV